jgi:hypothetical protein
MNKTEIAGGDGPSGDPKQSFFERMRAASAARAQSQQVAATTPEPVPPTVAAPPVAAPGATTNDMAMSPGGLNDAFETIYKISAILVAVAFVLVTIMSAFDIFSFYFKEVFQKFKLIIDPNLMNKDTTDVRSMDYIFNKQDDEPFNIFLEQQLVAFMFIVIACAMMALGLQLGSFFALKLFATVRGKPFEERVRIPMPYLGLILLVLLGSVMLNYIYKQRFIKVTQPTLKAVKGRMREIKSYIYTNMTNDSMFLKALTQDDMDKVMQALLDNAKDSKNASTLRKMMFTLNLYTYFRTQIPEQDLNYDTILTMFTSEGIRLQKLDPTMVFYYKTPIFVPNLYPTLREKLQPALGDRERTFLKDLGIIMKELNKRLTKLQMIGDGKRSLSGYMWYAMMATGFVATILMVALGYVFFKDKFFKIFRGVLKLLGQKDQQQQGQR